MRSADRVIKAMSKDLKEWTGNNVNPDGIKWEKLNFRDLYNTWMLYLTH